MRRKNVRTVLFRDRRANDVACRNGSTCTQKRILRGAGTLRVRTVRPRLARTLRSPPVISFRSSNAAPHSSPGPPRPFFFFFTFSPGNETRRRRRPPQIVGSSSLSLLEPVVVSPLQRGEEFGPEFLLTRVRRKPEFLRACPPLRQLTRRLHLVHPDGPPRQRPEPPGR